MKNYTVEDFIREVKDGHIMLKENEIYMTMSTITFVHEAIASAGLSYLENVTQFDKCGRCHVEKYAKGAFLEILNHTIKFLEATSDWSIASRVPINTFKGLSNQQAALAICKLLSETINRIDGDFFYFFWGIPFCQNHHWDHEDIECY